MKYLRIIIFLLLTMPLISWSSYAQFGVKVNYWRPTGVLLGPSLKNAIGPEIMFIDDFDNPFRTRIGFSFVNYKPRVDTFFVYDMQGSGNDFVVSKISETMSHFRDFALMAGADYSPIAGDESIVPYLGLSVVVSLTQISTSRYKFQQFVPYRESNESYGAIGLNARLGCDFWVKVGDVFVEYNGMFRFSPELGYYVFNSLGLGFRF